MGTNKSAEHINNAVKEIANTEKIYDADKIKNLLNVESIMPFKKLDPFIADPYSVLGQIIRVVKVNGNKPSDLSKASSDFLLIPLYDWDINENSKLKEPQLEQSLIINDQIIAGVQFFDYLQGQLDTQSVFSITLYNRTTGRIDQKKESWRNSISTWWEEYKNRFINENTAYLYVIVGFVLKEIIRKKYVKYESDIKAGAYGISVNGELHSSTDQYALDLRFGLEYGLLWEADNDYSKDPVLKSIRDNELLLKEKNYIYPVIIDEKHNKLFSTLGNIIFP